MPTAQLRYARPGYRETNNSRIGFYLNADRAATDIPHQTELGPMSNKNEKFKLALKKKKTGAIYLGHFIFNHSLLNDLNILTSILNDKFCNSYE